MTETTPDHIADRQYVVVVGVHDPDRKHEQATDVFGPFDYAGVIEFGQQVGARWEKADAEHGAAWCPYGVPYYDVRLLRTGVNPVKAAENWIYDPEVHGDDPNAPVL